MNDELALAPRDIAEAKALATILSKASILPTALRGKEADVLMTMMAGCELGIGPVLSLRSIHIIEGKPSLSADLIASLCLRSPLCEGLDLEESTATTATYSAHRKGRKPVRMSFTIEEAKLAGLVNKDNWRKYPAAMLRARCITSICRAVFPDLVGGLYDPEELSSERDVTPSRPVSVPQTGIVPRNEAETIAALTASIDGVKAVDAAKTTSKPRMLQITEEPKPDYGTDGAPVSERAKLEVAVEEAQTEAELTELVERITKLPAADKTSIRQRWGVRRDELRAAAKTTTTAVTP